MAFANVTLNRIAQTPSLLSMLAAPFRMIGRGLVALAEANSRMQAVKQLQELSDEQLAQLGTNRTAEIKRIFASSGAV